MKNPFHKVLARARKKMLARARKKKMLKLSQQARTGRSERGERKAASTHTHHRSVSAQQALGLEDRRVRKIWHRKGVRWQDYQRLSTDDQDDFVRSVENTLARA